MAVSRAVTHSWPRTPSSTPSSLILATSFCALPVALASCSARFSFSSRAFLAASAAASSSSSSAQPSSAASKSSMLECAADDCCRFSFSRCASFLDRSSAAEERERCVMVRLSGVEAMAYRTSRGVEVGRRQLAR